MAQTASIQQPMADVDPRRWIALAVLLGAAFMNLIDVTIVNVALPSMQTNMGATSSQIEWVIAAYVLTFALFLLPFGRLGDIVGKRRVFVAGVIAFTIISAFCGLAPNIEMLVIARVLQGIAGAALMPQVLAIIQDIFPREERIKAFSFFGATASIASVSGPLVGGFLIDLNIAGLDWRPIFLINIPLGIAVALLALRNIPKMAGNPELSVDWGGMLIVATAVFCLIFPLVEGRSFDWPVWIFVMMAASMPAFFAFVLWERYRDEHNASQLLPMSLITNRNYMVGTFIVMAFFSGLPGLFMVLVLYFQLGFGLSPLESGLATAPFPFGVFLASTTLSRMMGNRYMRQRLTAGIAMLIVAMFWIRHTVLGVSGELTGTVFLLPLLMAGFSVGVTISVIFNTVLAGVPPKDTGSGSGGLQAFQQMGAAIGIAVIGQIFFASLAANGAPTQASFKDATAAALIYDIALFATVIVLSLFLRTASISDEPSPQTGTAKV